VRELMKQSVCTGAPLLAKSHRWLVDSHVIRSSLRKCAVSVFFHSAKYSTLVANVRIDSDNETSANWIKDLELKQQRAFLDNLATKLGVKEVSSII